MQILANFTPPFSTLIKALKYQGGKNIAPFLAKMLYQHLSIPKVDLVTFIPLHKDKLRMRGYNQCQAIALELGVLLQVPVKNTLIRTSFSQAQAKITDPTERLRRMTGAFQLREKCREKLVNKTILLVDDIFTTGATVNAAAKELRKAMPSRIIIVALAKKT